MKRYILPLAATLALPLSSCSGVFYSHFSSIGEGYSTHEGVDLYTPVDQSIFWDSGSYYFFAPLAEYKHHTPLFERQPSFDKGPAYPEAENTKMLGKNIFVRVTPNPSLKSAEVTVWAARKGDLTYEVESGTDSEHINVRISGKKAMTLYNLKGAQKGKAQLEEIYTEFEIARYADTKSDGSLPGIVDLALLPLNITACLLDVTFIISFNTVNGIMAALFTGTTTYENPAGNPLERSTSPAKIIWL